MVNNPYEVLDLSEDSSEELLKARYEELSEKYREQRFAPGEEGNEGARKLMELEEAWSMILADLRRRKAKEQYGADLGPDASLADVDELIKGGKYDEAQAMLDADAERGAQWHYLQSIIFYKRDWLTESRKQLKMAVELEPENEKYKSALEKLEMVMGSPTVNAQSLGGNQVPPISEPDAQMTGNCLSNCCLAYCLTDLCCSMTRCCG